MGYSGTTTTSFTDGHGKLSLKFAGLSLEGKMGLMENLSLAVGSLAGFGEVGPGITESIPETFTGALENTPSVHHLTKSYYGFQPMAVIDCPSSPGFWSSPALNSELVLYLVLIQVSRAN